MSQRLNYMQQSPALFKKLADFSQLTKDSGLDTTLLHLIDIRASQLNGCAFCVDMHIKEATIAGERPLRLHHLTIWRESTLFTDRERAALAWTEALTHIPPHGAPMALFEEVRAHFNEQELSALSFAVAAINAWNRLNAGFQTPPGTHDKAFGLDKAGLV